MITKERLEKLIEQGATICGKIYGEIVDIKLSKKNKPEIKYDYRLDVYCSSNEYRNKMPFDHLWETREEAKWYLEFSNITRTETLSLPSWEEIKNNKEYFKSFSANNIVFNLAIDMPFDKDDGCIIITKEKNFSAHLVFERIPANKENYIEACELVKKLFLEEEV